MHAFARTGAEINHLRWHARAPLPGRSHSSPPAPSGVVPSQCSDFTAGRRAAAGSRGAPTAHRVSSSPGELRSTATNASYHSRSNGQLEIRRERRSNLTAATCDTQGATASRRR